ncbi:acyl-CoA synthetase FdrA [Yokenella regensburgei]|uniref:acyl-CoA synthetase FdrA n=1 Tax=Yokenella regensburgei TaxID=158877 RepID=UPI003F18B68B
MALHYQCFPNLYKDSVSLMQISARLNALDGVEQASVAMATPANLERMRDAGLEITLEARPNDLLIALDATDETAAQALELAASLLRPSTTQETSNDVHRPAVSIAMGVHDEMQANFALISVPGRYAAAEALKALSQGLHVMLFSDNVPEEQEAAIKRYASQHELLVMGPDCGTAIINGMPLGFANVVRRGSIGLVAASGTGLQEVSCHIHHLGAGVSQAIGTGGRDLHEAIGGLSMIQGIRMLAEDPDTTLIVLISKPPAPGIMQKVLASARQSGKPVVVHFLGAEDHSLEYEGVIPARSLLHAAEVAVATSEGKKAPQESNTRESLLAEARTRIGTMAAVQKDIRGVFAGGTFCYEAQLALLAAGLTCESNAPVQGAEPLRNPGQGNGHSLVDMGADEFTQGRPHPMIDPTLRNARLLSEGRDPATAVLLFDIVLGYGASADPCARLLPVLDTLQQEAARQQRTLLLIAHVCGTEDDPQNRQQQIARLHQAGVLVAESNIEAARLAAFVAQQRK